ncbi:DUF397 domain-containing protein [Actinoplanes sp. NPDC023936]|uniref:DUF397 domain-containing protein n=1 Tax=Actinoplanes sp. NPDC023936 TaxID=3154910 RepID=UPI003407D093
MTRAKGVSEPGSFYRHSLELIQAAHPNRSDSWHREQARAAMTAAFEAREQAIAGRDLPEMPTYPRTEADLDALEQDFKEGEKAGEARWQTSTTAKSGQPVQVAQVRGIICIRAGGRPDGPALYLTQPEWRIFARALERGVHPKAIATLRPEADRQPYEGLNEEKRLELAATGNSLIDDPLVQPC